MPSKADIDSWVNAQISQAAGLIARLGADPALSCDIPAAFEAYTLLMHLGADVPVRPLAGHLDIASPHLAWRAPAEGVDGALVLIAEIPQGMLGDIAFWLTDKMRSASLKAMPGVLALSFTAQIAEGAEVPILLPDWTAAFYPHGNMANCFPLLVFESMLNRGHVPPDWVETALHRLSHYHLPVDAALANLEMCRTGTL